MKLNALLYFVIQNLNDIFSEIWDSIIFLLPKADKEISNKWTQTQFYKSTLIDNRWFISPYTWLRSANDPCIFNKIIMITVNEDSIMIVITISCVLLCSRLMMFWTFSHRLALLWEHSRLAQDKHSNHHYLMVSDFS